MVLINLAGWPMSSKPAVPGSISIFPLPPRYPELNHVENVWQFIGNNLLSNHILTSRDKHPRPVLPSLG